MENNKKNLMIAADDFGISPVADKNILELVRQGKLDRVEIMMSKNIKPEDVETLLRSGIKLDIHLHLIEKKIDRWQNETELHVIYGGIIGRSVPFFWNLIFGDSSPRKATGTWEKQIRDFIALFGKKPDGISSHEHIHYFPPYFRKVLTLAKRYQISYLRLGKNSLKKEPSTVASIINYLKKKDIAAFSASGLETSDLMISYDWIADDFENFLKKLPPDKKTELVFHPEIESEKERLMAM